MLELILLSLAISIGLGFFTWQRRAVTGAVAFCWVVLAEIIYTAAFLFVLLSSSPAVKLFWENLRFSIGALGALTLVHFAITFTGRRLRAPKRFWAVLMAFPLVAVVLIYTDSWHHLIRLGLRLVEMGPYTLLVATLTPLGWLVVVYSLGLAAFAILLIVPYLLQVREVYRPQLYIILVGVCFPVLGVLLSIFARREEPVWGWEHLIFVVGNLIVSWGLFRHHLFDVVPIARHRLVETLPDAVMVLDNQQRVLDLNPAVVELLGGEAQAIIGQPAAEVIPHWWRYFDIYQTAAGKAFSIIFDDGMARRDFLVQVTSLDGDAGKLVVARDISEQKNIERELSDYVQKMNALAEELRVKNEHLQALSREKDRFIASVSHELRTPLTNIKLYLELLSLEPDQVGESLDILLRETERLAELIEDLLALSRFDQGVIALHYAFFDLNVMVEEFVRDRRAMAEARQIVLTAELDSHLPLVRADRNQIAQVLSILLTNAFNYSPDGGEVTVTTFLCEREGRHWIGFRVSDQGLGIPSQEIEHIFERFFRGQVARQSGVPGTGLGLAIADEIVRRHEGRIEASSEGVPGMGAEFTVLLPASDV